MCAKGWRMAMFKGGTPGNTLSDRLRAASEPAPGAAAGAAQEPGKRLPRQPVYSIATLTTASAKIPAVVRNVNTRGARVEFTANIPLRGDVSIACPVLGLNTRVRVAWQKGGSAGLIFVKQDR